MRQELDDATRASIVEYRLERCREALKEVDYLVEGGYYSSAVSRLYYACYYAAVALLVANRHEAQTHAGVKTLFSCHFVKTGRIDSRHGKTLNMLYTLRQTNDYDDFSFCDKETLEEIRPLAQNFIEAVMELIGFREA